MIDEAVQPLVDDPLDSHGHGLQKDRATAEEAFDPNVVKVVLDANGFALYFSRAPIPWDRDRWAGQGTLEGSALDGSRMYKHIGLYVYRRDFLLRLCGDAPDPSRKHGKARTAQGP